MTLPAAEYRSPPTPDHLKVIDMHPEHRAITADGSTCHDQHQPAAPPTANQS
jgi:hypothetical protein